MPISFDQVFSDILSVPRLQSRAVRNCARFLTVLLLCALLHITATAQGATRAPSQSDGINDPALDAKIEAILQQMTLEEKVGQLVQYSAGQPTGPGTGRSDYGDMIAKGQIGSLFNVTDPHQINM